MNLCMGQDFGRSGLQVVKPTLSAYSSSYLHKLSLDPYSDIQPTNTTTHRWERGYSVVEWYRVGYGMIMAWLCYYTVFNLVKMG